MKIDDSSGSGGGLDHLSGSVERVTFFSEESGFAVLRVKVRGHRDSVTFVGHSASIKPGEYVHGKGRWVNDRNYGFQFRCEFLRVTPPTTREGIEKYLGSGMIRGIGPVYARKLVNAFGEAVFDIVEEEPQRLREVPGIGPKRAEMIEAGWSEQKAVREIMLFLHSHGVGTSRAVRIYRTYGDDAVEIISENPYRLARDIRGIGFISADTIAASLGMEKTSVIRARAGITHTLSEASGNGHCGLPKEKLIKDAMDLLEIPGEILEEALALELEEKILVESKEKERECVFLSYLYHAEEYIAERLLGAASALPAWPKIDTVRALDWVGRRSGLVLSPSQREAAIKALETKVLVITGGPGVGKTTLVDTILTILHAAGVRIKLCAPTGRAAKRLSESTGHTAKTIHRLLEVDAIGGGFKKNRDNQLECDLLVVDEVSMVDVSLMRSLLYALPDSSSLLLVGDADQLPSVGPGQVLADIINSGAVPVVSLKEVFRQAAQSRIIMNAHRINCGKMPDWPEKQDSGEGKPESDFYMVQVENPEEAASMILRLVSERIPERFGMDSVRDVQVLCPMNKGGAGAVSLNIELQSALNPPGPLRIEKFGWVFCPGDKVMQIENDYEKEVFNGDIGVITAVDTESRELLVEVDGREIVYDTADLDRLVLAYATTVHKAQGSEYPAVVIPVLMQHYPMLQRKLLYTGVTRGRKLVVIVGQKKAVAIAVRGKKEEGRWSRLETCLRAG